MARKKLSSIVKRLAKRGLKQAKSTVRSAKRTAKSGKKTAKGLLREGRKIVKETKKQLGKRAADAKRNGGVSVSFVDKGLSSLLARVQKANPVLPTEIGVIAAGDAETAYLARIHEMGLGTAPQRSFLRGTLTANRKRYSALAGRAYAKFLDGTWSLEQASMAVAIEIVSDIQARILRGIAPRLAMATVAAKSHAGMSKPNTALFATGALFNSIRARLPSGELV